MNDEERSMSETALPPEKSPRIRLLDNEFNCLYDSATDDRTVEQFMRDQGIDSERRT
jgi:hypothetical protein